MTPNIVRKSEQIKLIMECRQSGLSDYQWCKTNRIPVKQEVVKLNLIGHKMPTPVMVEQNASHLPLSATANVAVEIQHGSITLRIFNGADISVVQSTLQCIGGMSDAW